MYHVTQCTTRFGAEAESFGSCSDGGSTEQVHCVSSSPSISLLSHVYITCVGRLPPVIVRTYYHELVLTAVACNTMAKLQRAAVQTRQWEHSRYRSTASQCRQPLLLPAVRYGVE